MNETIETNILSKPFNREDIKNLLINHFLPENFEINESRIFIDDIGKFEKIDEVSYIGKSDNPEINLLFIKHKGINDPRITITKETFKIVKAFRFKRSIIVYYSDNPKNYRISLVTLDIERKGEKGTADVLSNPKRYSYFLGLDAKVKTPHINLVSKGRVKTDEDLKERFSVEVVTKEFYKELANWYFWAVKKVKFPEYAEKEKNGRNIAVIRLITRMIFIWFMKEKKLVPSELFNFTTISNLLNNQSNNESTYYKAILQNLFFATLNTKIKDRKFRFQKIFQGKNHDYMDHSVYRYEKYFKNKEKAISLFKNIPFLNGGLFDCLDKRIIENDKNKEIRIDGFSDKEVELSVPNFLFFSKEREIDLNEEYGTKGKTYKVSGLINIFSLYNFTIDENTIDDQEIALDPELLGQVFENLLASYDPITATTARKESGSYYTPREIVDYMVSESLKEYFKTNSDDISSIDEKIEIIFSKEEEINPFNEQETKKIIKLIDNLRIIDPAVGSGAFPMGILNKLVFILSKLDPDNRLWEEAQIDAVNKNITDPVIKSTLIEEIERQFKKDKSNDSNYGRKLYLIQKCIYGVDIQEIAVEIAKLRFFISLLVDEKIDEKEENWGIKPLPNLDFKIMQGNSLISKFMGIDLDKDEVNDDNELFRNESNEMIEEFQNKKNEFQNESDKKKKNKLMDEINNILVNIFERKIKKQKQDYFKDLKNIEDKYSVVPNQNHREEIINKEKEKLYKEYGFDMEFAEKQFRDFTESKKIKPFFAWKLYFAEVFKEKDGFDIVIGNPPYGDILKREEKETIKKTYKFSTTSDIASTFVERGINLLRDKGILTYIITYAITFNKDFSANRYQMSEYFKENYIYSFDRDKCRIFKSMTQSVSIIKCFNKNSKIKKGIFSSIMYRNTPYIYEIKVNNCDKYLLPKNSTYHDKHRLPKLGDDINVKILDKLFQNKNIVGAIINGNSVKGVWIRTSGNYWYNAFDRKPYNSVEISSLYVNKDYSNFIILLMNSSLFYFWFRIYGDGRHMNMDILEGFPLTDREKILKYNILLNKAKERFMNKLFSVFDKQHNRFLTSNIKNEIDMLDLILGRYLYNFSYNEIIHILNYDSEIRGGNKLEEQFATLVDKILSITKDGDYLENPRKQSEVKEYEKQIDQMIYKLYNLTPEEIKIVENTCNK